MVNGSDSYSWVRPRYITIDFKTWCQYKFYCFAIKLRPFCILFSNLKPNDPWKTFEATIKLDLNQRKEMNSSEIVVVFQLICLLIVLSILFWYFFYLKQFLNSSLYEEIKNKKVNVTIPIFVNTLSFQFWIAFKLYIHENL